YAGDEILGLAAATEEQMNDAIRAVKISFQELDHLVEEDDALKAPDKATVFPKNQKNVKAPQTATSAGFQKGLTAEGAVVHQGEYGMSTICHQCLESHGLVANWEQDGSLTIFASTQAVTGTAAQIAKYFSDQGIDLPATKVKCITHHMGGGYGS